MQSQVYFIIECPFTDKVAIGKSTNVKETLSSLQAGNPAPLAVLFTINYMDNLERVIHTDLTACGKHIFGEWFQLNLTDIAAIYAKYRDYKFAPIEETDDSNNACSDWIKNNLPKYRESISGYYARYRTAVCDHVSHNQFGKLVSEEGYDAAQGRIGRYWKKTKWLSYD